MPVPILAFGFPVVPAAVGALLDIATDGRPGRWAAVLGLGGVVVTVVNWVVPYYLLGF